MLPKSILQLEDHGEGQGFVAGGSPSLGGHRDAGDRLLGEMPPAGQGARPPRTPEGSLCPPLARQWGHLVVSGEGGTVPPVGTVLGRGGDTKNKVSGWESAHLPQRRAPGVGAKVRPPPWGSPCPGHWPRPGLTPATVPALAAARVAPRRCLGRGDGTRTSVPRWSQGGTRRPPHRHPDTCSAPSTLHPAQQPWAPLPQQP